MNCSQCREELAAYLEGLLDETCQSQIEAHLASCPTCQAEYESVRQLTDLLASAASVLPAVALETAVMDRIVQEQARELRRLKMRKRLRTLGISGALTAMAATLLLSSVWLTQPASAQKAAETLARGAEAVPQDTTVHFVAQMRTLPADNFSMIGPKYDFVPVEVWKQFGATPKWRVEKPGRVAVMDGKSTTLLFRRTHEVVSIPRATKAAFDTGPLLRLANIQDMLTEELRSAQAHGWELKQTQETTATGEKQIIVTVEAKAGLPEKDILKNKFFDTSDTRRTYRFDAKTGRLEQMQADFHQPGGDVTILKVERIDYGQPIDPAVYTLKLPEKVSRHKDPEPLPDNEKYERMTPPQIARAFFEACEKKDWNEVQKLCEIPVDERLKTSLGGLKILSLGEPFQSAADARPKDGDWFIPYEIRTKDGQVHKSNLSLRKFPSAKRYMVAGLTTH